MTTKTSKLISPKIQGIATNAFNNAFGDSIDYEDPKIAKLILAYSALLELGAEYIELKAFKRVHDHLLANPLTDEKPVTYEDSLKHLDKK